MDRFYVYEHRRADTGAVFYVGKGQGDRAYRHTSRNPFWKSTAAKHGLVVDMLVVGIDEELAHLVEVERIDQHRRRGARLTNLTIGGEGISGFTRKPSAEEVERRRLSNTGKRRTPEQCQRIALAKQGHGVGRKQSPETIAKRMVGAKGRPRPDVTERMKGRPRPAHVIEALRASNDARYAARRLRLEEVIATNPGATIAELSRLSGCEREMVAKYRRGG